MTHAFRSAVLVVSFSVAGCASTGPTVDCSLSDQELRLLQANAFDFLVEEWPIQDKNCEEISDHVIVVEPGKCAIVGGPKRMAGCAAPLHRGYNIVFDPETLGPEDIHFKTE